MVRLRHLCAVWHAPGYRPSKGAEGSALPSPGNLPAVHAGRERRGEYLTRDSQTLEVCLRLLESVPVGRVSFYTDGEVVTCPGGPSPAMARLTAIPGRHRMLPHR